MFFFVQDIRVELIRPFGTTDFKSVVSTDFTNPAFRHLDEDWT